MRTRTTNKDGSGNGGWANFVDWIYRKFEELQFYDSTTVAVEQTTRGVRWHVKPIVAGTAGFNWQAPNKELNPAVSVSKDTFVYISPLNTLVTAGMTDLITHANVISCEGIWQAAQAVPAATGGEYNVPVFPYPSGMGVTIPSGTPLAGDLDAATGSPAKPAIYWIYWGQVAC